MPNQVGSGRRSFSSRTLSSPSTPFPPPWAPHFRDLHPLSRSSTRFAMFSNNRGDTFGISCKVPALYTAHLHRSTSHRAPAPRVWTASLDSATHRVAVGAYASHTSRIVFSSRRIGSLPEGRDHHRRVALHSPLAFPSHPSPLPPRCVAATFPATSRQPTQAEKSVLKMRFCTRLLKIEAAPAHRTSTIQPHQHTSPSPPLLPFLLPCPAKGAR